MEIKQQLEADQYSFVGTYFSLLSILWNSKIALLGGGPSADGMAEKLAAQNYLIFQVNDHAVRRADPFCDALFISPIVPMTAGQLLNFTRRPLFVCSMLDYQNQLPPIYTELKNNLLHKKIPITFWLKNKYRFKNPYSPALEWYNTFAHEIATSPLTGMIAIKFLLGFPLAELHIAGFDFYHHANTTKMHSHFLPTQKQWLVDTWQKDLRLEICPEDCQKLGITKDLIDRRGVGKTYEI